MNQRLTKSYYFPVASASGDFIISRLVTRRKSRNISQKQLAYRMGIDPASLCKYEKGYIRPSIDMLFLWCDALGLTMDLKEKFVYDLP